MYCRPDWTRKAALILTLPAALFLLTACGGSGSPVVEPPPAPPPSLAAPCDVPVNVPVRDVTQDEAERWWRADRARLVRCAEKHQGLVDWSERLSGQQRNSLKTLDAQEAQN